MQIKTTTYGITACAKSKKSALGVRGFDEVSVTVDITRLSPAIIDKLLEDVLTKKLRASLANIDKNTATPDDIRAAMSAAFENLVTATKAKRTQSRTAKVRSMARAAVREAFVSRIEASGEEPNKEQVTAFLKNLFDGYDKWVKNPEGNPKNEKLGRYVQNAIDTADRRLSEQEANLSDLDTLVGELAETKAATSAPKAARPTPTEGVARRRKAQAQGGPAA